MESTEEIAECRFLTRERHGKERDGRCTRLLRFDRAAHTHLSEQAPSAIVCSVGLTWRAVEQRRQAEHF